MAMQKVLLHNDLPPLQGNLTEMVRELKKALREEIGEKTWLDNSTKSWALKKVDAINDLLVSPEQFKDDTRLNKFYAGVSIQGLEGWRAHILHLQARGQG